METTVASGRLGATIADLRRRSGLSQGDLAAAAGCSRAFVGLLESGKRGDLSLTLAAGMCRALGVGVDALLPNPPAEDPVERIVGALRAHGCAPRARQDGYTARCPLHPPTRLPVVTRTGEPATAHTPGGAAKRRGDLEVYYDAGSRRRRARIVLKCAAGCAPADVLRALDLPPRLLRVARHVAGAPQVVTVGALAAYTGLAQAFLEDLGLRDCERGVEIPYYDQDGEQIATRLRLRLALPPRKPRPPGRRPSSTARPVVMPPRRRDPRFAWRAGSRDTLYGLDWLEDARAAGFLLVVEGESDCWACWAAGFPALGLPGAGLAAGGGGRADTADLLEPPHFVGVREVYVVREPDLAGAAFARDVCAKVRECGKEPSVLPFDRETKDILALYREGPATFARRLRQRMAVAVSPERSAAT